MVSSPTNLPFTGSYDDADAGGVGEIGRGGGRGVGRDGGRGRGVGRDGVGDVGRMVST